MSDVAAAETRAVARAAARGRGARATTLWLRVASGISLLFTAGHTLGGLKRWSPMGDNEVLRQMTGVRFDVQGVSRSYLDFFMGFGWSISVAMVLQTVLLWQLASMARTNPAGARPMIAALALATLASGVIAWRFIFPLPALFSTALVIPLAVAFVVAGRGDPPDTSITSTPDSGTGRTARRTTGR